MEEAGSDLSSCEFCDALWEPLLSLEGLLRFFKTPMQSVDTYMSLISTCNGLRDVGTRTRREIHVKATQRFANTLYHELCTRFFLYRVQTHTQKLCSHDAYITGDFCATEILKRTTSYSECWNRRQTLHVMLCPHSPPAKDCTSDEVRRIFNMVGYEFKRYISDFVYSLPLPEFTSMEITQQMILVPREEFEERTTHLISERLHQDNFLRQCWDAYVDKGTDESLANIMHTMLLLETPKTPLVVKVHHFSGPDLTTIQHKLLMHTRIELAHNAIFIHIAQNGAYHFQLSQQSLDCLLHRRMQCIDDIFLSQQGLISFIRTCAREIRAGFSFHDQRVQYETNRAIHNLLANGQLQIIPN